MNKQTETNNPDEDDKTLYSKSQYKGICMNRGKYGYKLNKYWYGESANIQKYQYCNKLVHLKK